MDELADRLTDKLAANQIDVWVHFDAENNCFDMLFSKNGICIKRIASAELFSENRVELYLENVVDRTISEFAEYDRRLREENNNDQN